MLLLEQRVLAAQEHVLLLPMRLATVDVLAQRIDGGAGFRVLLLDFRAESGFRLRCRARLAERLALGFELGRERRDALLRLGELSFERRLRRVRRLRRGLRGGERLRRFPEARFALGERRFELCDASIAELDPLACARQLLARAGRSEE